MIKSKKKKIKRYFMLVSNDKLELPLCAPMNAMQMAEKLGVRKETIYQILCPSYINRKDVTGRYKTKDYKVVPVMLEEY